MWEWAQEAVLFFFFNLFIYFWLCWVFISVRGLSLVVASGGHSSLRCAGLSLSRPLLLRSTGSRRAGSVVVAHGPSCSAACGIFPDQGSNPCPLHWQADSQQLHHQGSPGSCTFNKQYLRFLWTQVWEPQTLKFGSSQFWRHIFCSSLQSLHLSNLNQSREQNQIFLFDNSWKSKSGKYFTSNTPKPQKHSASQILREVKSFAQGYTRSRLA